MLRCNSGDMGISQATRNVREASAGWMVNRIALMLDNRMKDRLDALGLSKPQFAIMMIVLENGTPTQAEIGKYIDMPAYSVSRALDDLQERGFIERQQHPESRRALQIIGTPKGQDLGPKLFEIVRDVNRTFLEPLSPDERATFLALLGKLLRR